MKKANIEIMVRDTKTGKAIIKTVDGYIHEGYGLHRDIDHNWTVTELKTGFRCNLKDYSTRKEAVADLENIKNAVKKLYGTQKYAQAIDIFNKTKKSQEDKTMKTKKADSKKANTNAVKAVKEDKAMKTKKAEPKKVSEVDALKAEIERLKAEIERLKKAEAPKATAKKTAKKAVKHDIETFDVKAHKASGERITDALVKALNDTKGVKAEMLGTWLWVTGDTKAHKDTLKELGFIWSGKKQAWYLSPYPLRRNYKSKCDSVNAVRSAIA